jgi:multidrug resistance efflux pump
VTEVPVESNTPLNDGHILFRIDPKPYQYVVDQKTASLTEAEQKVTQLKQALDKASADAERANAQRQLAQDNYDRQAELFAKQVVARATLDTATRNLDVSKQSFAAAKAEEESARTAFTSNVEGVNTLVAKARAELADAQFDLDQTTIRAAGPGFVTQVSLRPGMYVVPMPIRPAMLFINTGDRDAKLVAAFQQNSLQRVRAGDDAEVAFDAVPGRVFKAKVRSVIDAIAPGQLENSIALVDPETRTAAGRALAQIDVSDEMHDYQIPLGSKAQVAIYTDHLHDLSLLRKILLRMKSWQNYVFLEGH